MIKDHVSWIMDQGSSIMDHGSQIKDHGSKIMDHGSRIKVQGSRILDLGPWTLFWHERPFQKGSGRDIKTVQIYNRFSIMLYRCWKLKQGQHGRFRRIYQLFMIFYRTIECFFDLLFRSGDHFRTFQASRTKCQNFMKWFNFLIENRFFE